MFIYTYMITSYQKYLDRIDALSKEKVKAVQDFKEKLKDDMDLEFSKYFEKIQNKIHKYKKEEDVEIYLVDDDYGLIFTINYNPYSANISAFIKAVYKKDNIWIESKGFISYEYNRPIEDFVKETVETFKKRNISRKKERDTRERNRNIKKYNL